MINEDPVIQFDVFEVFVVSSQNQDFSGLIHLRNLTKDIQEREILFLGVIHNLNRVRQMLLRFDYLIKLLRILFDEWPCNILQFLRVPVG